MLSRRPFHRMGRRKLTSSTTRGSCASFQTSWFWVSSITSALPSAKARISSLTRIRAAPGGPGTRRPSRQLIIPLVMPACEGTW